ncbi:hypothetical protein EVAR_65958_1 [Eumeta japonica]|uniref:Uncharacterized protein n=1 Tax=Eumeta variegata TaxID=151549 RepID=A0A4C1Z9H4_EUMVA|nr:hypothetical protein EVAR_65958_1 [Eumeta japonica]
MIRKLPNLNYIGLRVHTSAGSKTLVITSFTGDLAPAAGGSVAALSLRARPGLPAHCARPAAYTCRRRHAAANGGTFFAGSRPRPGFPRVHFSTRSPTIQSEYFNINSSNSRCAANYTGLLGVLINALDLHIVAFL